MDPLKCVVLLAVFVTPVLGQVVIDWAEIPQNIGIEFTHNSAESVTVNIGSSGGPQSWSFTTQPMGSQNVDALIVPRESTPYGDSFPNANLVLQITANGYTVYAYSQIAPSFSCELGVGSVSPVTFYRFEPADSIPLPIVYGATRHYYSSSTVEFTPSVVIRTDDYGFETIDAYGSVTIPYGTFECLRSCSFDTIVTTMLISGIPITVDTTTNIIYNFLAENYGLITHVLSYAEEANPNFTNALFLERLTNFSTGVEELQPVAVSDVSCYPNPFTQFTNIRFMIHDTRYMEQELRNSNFEMRKHTLEIYDAAGRMVKSFRIIPSAGRGLSSQGDGAPDALRTTLSWDGRDDQNRMLSSGIYFLRFIDDGTILTRKALLIR